MCFYLLLSTAWPWSSSGTPSAIPGREQQLPGGCSTRENLAPSHSAPGVLPEVLFPPLGAQQTAQHERFCCTSAEDCFSENLRRFFGGGFWFFLVGFRCLVFFLIGKGSSVALQSTVRSSVECDCILCSGMTRSPITEFYWRKKIARLGSRSELKPLVPHFLLSCSWDVDEGWLATFPPMGRSPRSEPERGSTPVRHWLSQPLQPSTSISQELHILVVGSRGPPGKLSHRNRNVPASHSV